jgi:hypothetical protein
MWFMANKIFFLNYFAYSPAVIFGNKKSLLFVETFYKISYE